MMANVGVRLVIICGGLMLSTLPYIAARSDQKCPYRYYYSGTTERCTRCENMCDSTVDKKCLGRCPVEATLLGFCKNGTLYYDGSKCANCTSVCRDDITGGLTNGCAERCPAYASLKGYCGSGKFVDVDASDGKWEMQCTNCTTICSGNPPGERCHQYCRHTEPKNMDMTTVPTSTGPPFPQKYIVISAVGGVVSLIGCVMVGWLLISHRTQINSRISRCFKGPRAFITHPTDDQESTNALAPLPDTDPCPTFVQVSEASSFVTSAEDLSDVTMLKVPT